ncbi:PWWP domain-containing DNA repair factor 3A isoform X1 [Leopardus geoffroyi]|uniref:PWWP domain-containing DNA repair factor 3A isoform X1 n=1 Tax=Leopardus geoffroyi TaxID=46844 RepID=UPI001E2616B2|nr:PWWP domain-containing DNA repair factor 3A isoform X1 [Leopardus geoffroyi]XP_045347175.1 PWWP domain-containing DNA repair factor 3A isoform X1 [Leopardus geoffroyi]XP_045347176.1 PWWP domain-containing DNA repair factor 3A isoform X1 [Leopardus geoffroyi]XP_045347178.1 PWWP domain-containing DNA repair factor 3A isoform X1 [Leopardus geoffroyi]
MTDAKYVLCRWEKRLWPAKVLARTEVATKNKRKKEFFLSVQILSLDEKIKVRSTKVEALKVAHIERIASTLASQDEVPAEPLEELAYRRSLRVALDVLKESTGLPQESPSREERTALCSREKPMELASLLCDPASSCVQEAVPGRSGPERRERVHPRLSGSPTCQKDPKCQVDHKKELRTGGSPQALVVPPARGGSQEGRGSGTRCASRTTPSKRGRSLAREPTVGQSAPSVSEGDDEESRLPAPGSPPTAKEEGLWAKGRDPSLPLPGPTGRPACPDAQGLPAKRPCPDSGRRPPAARLEPGAVASPRQGPGKCRALPSAARLHLPAPRASTEETGDLGVLVEEAKARPTSGESVERAPIRSVLEEEDDEEEPPRILLYHEPRSFEVGMLVWLKHQKYPFWPAVVKSVRRREKKASVLFIEGHMDPKGRGITVSLRRLKHFDCKEKQELLNEAKEDFDQAIGWCVSLITDYRVRLGCGSFAGSFLEYYAADISYPVRKSIQQDVLGTRFPQLSKGDPEEPVAGSPQGRRRPRRKVLPDRSRAARDRANQKLVEYIVKARGAEGHLRAILRNRKPSRWLKTFLNSGQYVTCVETYLEDEEQLDLVVKYLQGVYQETGSRALARINADRIRFVLDVLLPEAIICAIAAVDAVDYETAEAKYLRGPSLSYREKEMFDNQLLEERSQRC